MKLVKSTGTQAKIGSRNYLQSESARSTVSSLNGNCSASLVVTWVRLDELILLNNLQIIADC